MKFPRYRDVCETQIKANYKRSLKERSLRRNCFGDLARELMHFNRHVFAAAVAACLVQPNLVVAQTVFIDEQAISVSAPFSGAELQFFSLDGTARDFEVPTVFGSVLRVGTAISLSADAARLDEVLRIEGFRRELYRSAILATIAAPSLSRLEPSAASGLSIPVSSDLAATLVDIAATATGTAGSLADALQSIDTTLQTPTLSALGRDATAVGIISFATQIVSDIRSAEERARIIAEAATDAELVAALNALKQLMSTQRNHDPAMVAGLSDAIVDIDVMSRDRLRTMATSSFDAVKNAVPDIAVAVIIAKNFAGGPAIVAREVMALHGVVDDFAERALLVAAQHTIASHAQPLLLALLEEDASFDGLDSSSLPMMELLWFQTRLTADASAATYTTLWEDRWSNPLSLGALSRGTGLLIAETRSGRRDLRAVYRQEVADRAAMHFSIASLPAEAFAQQEITLGELQVVTFMDRLQVEFPADMVRDESIIQPSDLPGDFGPWFFADDGVAAAEARQRHGEPDPRRQIYASRQSAGRLERDLNFARSRGCILLPLDFSTAEPSLRVTAYHVSPATSGPDRATPEAACSPAFISAEVSGFEVQGFSMAVVFNFSTNAAGAEAFDLEALARNITRTANLRQ